MILIPVKDLSKAKQRLSPVLDQESRTELAQAMVLDVFEALAQGANLPQVAVVTSDEFTVALAEQFGFEILLDENKHSETDAIEMATGLCEQQGVESTLVIPGDIPLIQATEIEEILAKAPARGSVLVPAADGRGTNAAWRKPAGLFPLRFGNDSFKPHHRAACATGERCVVLSLPGIGLDVDNPADLQQLAASPGDRRSQRLARQWDLTDYPLAANE